MTHMSKTTSLSNPNWLLPSHLITLKLVVWVHNQTIFKNGENHIRETCQLNLHPIVNQDNCRTQYMYPTILKSPYFHKLCFIVYIIYSTNPSISKCSCKNHTMINQYFFTQLLKLSTEECWTLIDWYFNWNVKSIEHLED